MLGGTADDWARLREAWGERFMPRLQLIADQRDEHARADARRHAGGLRADDAPLVAAGARLARRAGAGGPAALLRQLEHAQPREHRDGRGARARGRARASSWRSSCRRTTSCARSSRPSARAAAEGSWENFLYFVARLYFDSHGEEGREARRRSEAECGVSHIRSTHGAAGAGADHPAVEAEARADGPAARRRGRRGAGGGRGRDREHRLPARRGGLQHPPRGGGGQLDAARRVRARQGGDAERRRGRRDALDRRPRRALGLDLLARQRVQRGRHRAGPALRQRARQPARGHGEEHVPAEPLLPRLLLPRGVHGGGDGGGAVLQRDLRDRRRRPPPGRARR